MTVCEQRPEASRELARLAIEILVLAPTRMDNTVIGLDNLLHESFQIKSDED